MEIDIQTRLITLIGTPLEQSFAARMQNAAYRAANINMAYFYTETDATHLGDIVNGIRYMPSFRGFAVTKPNKVAVLPYLDELDPFCRKIGACNTVVKTDDGRLVGYNTDGHGFLISLQQEGGATIRDGRFFCIGAGGAGRSIASVLAYRGAGKLYITDAFEENAHALVDDVNRQFAPVAEFVPYGEYGAVRDCDVVINASGIGMGRTRGRNPLPKQYILPDRLYFDACYNPLKTQFLLDAEEKGARILNGLGMSLYQGAVQIELWTGKPAPIEAMRAELMALIQG